METKRGNTSPKHLYPNKAGGGGRVGKREFRGEEKRGLKSLRRESHERREQGASRKSRRQGRCGRAQVAGGLEAVFLENTHRPLSPHLLRCWHRSKENTNISVSVVFSEAGGKERRAISPPYFLACSRATQMPVVVAGGWGGGWGVRNAYKGCVSWVTLIVQKHT